MAQGPLQKITATKLALHASFFQKAVDRIEGIVPIAGQYVKTKQTESGIEISLDTEKVKDLIKNNSVSSGPVGPGTNPNLIELDVCRNGEPSILLVYGFEP